MKIKSRKEARKELRKAKKVKKHAFFSKKNNKNKQRNKDFQKKICSNPVKHQPEVDKKKSIEEVFFNPKKKPVEKGIIKQEFRNSHERHDFDIRKEKMEREKLERDIREQRIKQLKADNKLEDIEINKLGKQLKLNQGNLYNQSNAFTLDGLNYLLDICDHGKHEHETEKYSQYSDSEFGSDIEHIVNSSMKQDEKATKAKRQEKKKKRKHANDDEDLGSLDSEIIDEEDNEENMLGSEADENNTIHEDEEDDLSVSELSRDKEDEMLGKALDGSEEDMSVSEGSEDEDLNFSELDSLDTFYDDEEIKYDKSKRRNKIKRKDRVAEKIIPNKSSKNAKIKKKKKVHFEDENTREKEQIKMESKEFEELKNKMKGRREKAKKVKARENKNQNKKKIVTTTAKKFQNKKKNMKLYGEHFFRIEQQCDDYISSDGMEDDKCMTAQNMPQMPVSMWEDICCRIQDGKGKITQAYIPPQLRKKPGENDNEKNSEKLARLRKQLKGLLNRLAESNMAFISNQVEQLYMTNSRNAINEALSSLLSESLFTEDLTPERFITEHAMLIAVLHSNIGSEIGAHFLQFAVNEFNKLLESNPPVENKRINNILSFIMNLYNFQVFNSKLMYDIINKLLKNLNEKQIELLLNTFRTVGFNLRKDDPAALKSVILKVQRQANTIQTGENSSRFRFMLDMLMAIKNNNMSKIPNYNPEYSEKLRKNLKHFVKKGNYNTELNISLQDLLNAEKHGRWWVVGSAWTGPAPAQSDANRLTDPSDKTNTEFSVKLLELAKKQRMNTEVRRNIFCTLMSAEDFLEAFHNLMKLKLKGPAEREIMNVLLHCAIQEKNYNPYYVFLANKFCVFDRKYQMMLQCAVWDKIKEIQNLLPVQVTNLAKFVGNIILEKGLPISVLKVIQFSELDEPTIKFTRQVLLSILLAEDQTASTAVFKRVADSPKLKLFRESLRLFLQHFIVKNIKNLEEEKVSRLADMVKVAEQALTSSDSTMIF